MKFFSVGKDGGPESTVTGYWLCEIKSLFSVVLLKFEDGSRDRYHTHAFESWNWVLAGIVREKVRGKNTDFDIPHGPSLKPVRTRRSTLHKVVSIGTTWVLSIRGPWSKTWREWDPKTGEYTELTHGRVEV